MGASGLCGRDVSGKDAAVIRWLARIPRTDGFARRMATVYAAFFLFGGIQMPYLPAPMLIRIVAVPLATRLVDRRGEVQSALATAATLSTAGHAIMEFAGGFTAILAAYGAISVLSSPVLPFAECLWPAWAQGARRGLMGGCGCWDRWRSLFANMAGGTLLSRLGALPLVWVLARPWRRPPPSALATVVAGLRTWRGSYPT
jgi:MFS transporter, PPP family, 3-phenylpropionic acid transporter